MKTKSTVEDHFTMCRALLDQLPGVGYYVLFVVNGTLNLPITAVETQAEALSAEAHEGAHKIILTGKRPYRLWRLGVKDMPIMLLAEHSTFASLQNDAHARSYAVHQSGPDVPKGS